MEQVAALRAGLFQEFDRLDTDAAERLAKFYAYYGFGSEAVQVLRFFSDDSADFGRVEAIARLMDDEAMADLNPFSDQQRCGGDTALWAVLTEGHLAKDAKLNSIEQSFTRLPQHLKVQFGPELAEILVKADRLEASHRVLRAVDRVDEADRPKVALAKAEVAVAEGDDQSAEDLLTQAATASEATEEAPLALARLIEKRWADRGAVTGRELDLIAAYAVQFRSAEMGPTMARAHAVALGLNQEFGAAFARFPDDTGGKAWRRTHGQVLQLLAERADDVTFLRFALSLSADAQESVPTETAIALSERLTRLGFSEHGLALANRKQDSVRRADRTKLRALAALQVGQPRQALLELAEDRSEAAMHLRAEALIDSQDFAGAALVLQEIDQTDAAGRNFWRAGLMEEARAEDPGMYGTLAQLSQSLAAPVNRQPEKPLADAAELLESSASMRQQIEKMFGVLKEGRSD